MATDVLERLKWRYATKKFDASKRLSEEKLSILKESFNLTATSYGLQPLKMIILSNPDLKKLLVPITMDQDQVENASHVLVICTETKIDSDYIKDHFNLVVKIRSTPREILSSFEEYLVSSFSDKQSDELNIWSTNQAYLALGNLLTVCAIEKIDACPIEGFDPDKYDELLQLNEKGLQSVIVLAVGYRAEDDMFSGFDKVRKGVDEVIIEMD
ncbi:MAG: NAD(P)H-dependent oxidoreductase [Bacteroidetes bacterium]|nr:NAD(P)H-dependent oxidoreductase [Bacteroidota bacterium]